MYPRFMMSLILLFDNLWKSRLANDMQSTNHFNIIFGDKMEIIPYSFMKASMSSAFLFFVYL